MEIDGEKEKSNIASATKKTRRKIKSFRFAIKHKPKIAIGNRRSAATPRNENPSELPGRSGMSLTIFDQDVSRLGFESNNEDNEDLYLPKLAAVADFDANPPA